MPEPRFFAPAAAITLLLMLPSQRLQAADLVVNGRFDNDVSSWQTDAPLPPTWTPLDANGASGSGSGAATNASAQAGERIVVLRQCVDNLEPGRYFIAGAGYLASGQVAGRLGISVAGFVGPGCTGGAQLLAGTFVTATDSWQRTTFRGPAGSASNGTLGSVWLRLFVEKDPAGGTLSGNFDDLAVDRILLEEGFEAP